MRRLGRHLKLNWPLLLGPLVAILLVFGIIWLAKSYDRHPAPVDSESAQPAYVIEEIVQGRMIVVKVRDQIFPSGPLADGIAEVCRKFDVKDGLPIVEPVGSYTATTAVILFVEPKAPAQNVSK
ncbi:MAG: hypothetical protein AAB642_02575 [Patescibacteria group bacterium]